jgi:hypothetical protein
MEVGVIANCELLRSNENFKLMKTKGEPIDWVENLPFVMILHVVDCLVIFKTSVPARGDERISNTLD